MTNFNFDFLKGTFVCSLFFYLTASFSVQSQELYDMESITEIKIYFSQNNWDQLLDQYYLNEMDERLIADSVLINGSMKDSVGVKYKGNSTFNENNAKNPINIALDYVHNNQDYQGFRTLKLSSGQKDPSFLREVLSYEVARKYMQAPLSNFARVYINGNYHGLYSSSESVNKDFQRNYLYADNNNTRVKCNPVSVFNGGSSLVYLGNDSASYYDYYELKSDYGWQDLIDLTNEINNSPENIENHLDIEQNPQFISDRNKDFFQIQHAWSKKNLDGVKDKMTTEVHSEFMNEIAEMNSKGHTSTLENLMVNKTEVTDSWEENSTKYMTLKFEVSLIEYEADKNGNIISGNKDSYTDITEFWTFSQENHGRDWKVSGVENPA